MAAERTGARASLRADRSWLLCRDGCAVERKITSDACAGCTAAPKPESRFQRLMTWLGGEDPPGYPPNHFTE